MKNNVFKLLFAFLFATICLTSCNQEESSRQNNNDVFNSLVFKVDVSTTNDTRAASDNKKTWTDGDQIIISIDGSNTNLCVLKYDGEDWNVDKLSSTVSFSTSGKLNAVYAEKLSYSDNKITTQGDILYTKDGTYRKDDNVVYITLNMNIRPLAKIQIDGNPDGFYIDNLKECSVLNISDMSWTSTSNSKYVEKDSGNIYTYYGNIESSNGNTTIRLVNSNGSYYEKEFAGKIIQNGDYIVIKGPLKTDDWNKKIFIETINPNKVIQLLVGETDELSNYYSISPTNATEKDCIYESSDNNVVTVDKAGNIKAIAKGNATITIRASQGGSMPCVISATVKDITDYISAYCNGGSMVIINGIIQHGSKLNWTLANNSSKNITLISMQLVDGVSGAKGNEMSINQEVSSKSTVSYSTTIGYLGIHAPVTCIFKYQVDGNIYNAMASYQ